MAIYNIDNIRSINEAGAHKKFIKKAIEADRKHTAKANMYKDLENRYRSRDDVWRALNMMHKSNEHREKSRFGNTEDQQQASKNIIYDEHLRRRNGYKGLSNHEKEDMRDRVRIIKKSLQDRGKDYIGDKEPNRYLNVAKASKAKLKEAAQYILDVLDEQEYYDEYDNSNDYYYYE